MSDNNHENNDKTSYDNDNSSTKKHTYIEICLNGILKALFNVEVDLSSSIKDLYTDTFGPELMHHDKEDLKHTNILFPLVFSYHLVYLIIFAMLFYFSFQQSITTVFLSPFEENHGSGCLLYTSDAADE